jgi:hypothetical protein
MKLDRNECNLLKPKDKQILAPLAILWKRFLKVAGIVTWLKIVQKERQHLFLYVQEEPSGESGNPLEKKAGP